MRELLVSRSVVKAFNVKQLNINKNLFILSKKVCSNDIYFSKICNKKALIKGFLRNWHPVGESNPCCRDENPVS